jgi:hypothetical protein
LFSAAFAAEKDAFMGLYEGFWTAPDGKQGRITAQVRPISQGRYDGFVAIYRAKTFEGALKLAFAAPEADGASLKFSANSAKAPGGSLVPPLQGACVIANGKMTGTFKGDLGDGKFEAHLTSRSSPTLGAKPPASGIVLFDGTPASTNQWSDFRWKITPEGAMVAGGGDIHSREKLSNFRLHVEFRTPLMRDGQGQGRGNSGIYMEGKYEVQVLDSFGTFPLQNNDCSAIYSLAAPEINACLPPGEWQTYDITYTRGPGAPMLSVVFNGVTVIDRFEIPANAIEAGTASADKEGGYLKLQDHGDAVEYRNIWLEPLAGVDRK